jgi:hypothetical protein
VGVPSDRTVQWLRALAETWQNTDRWPSLGQAYVAKRLAAGDTKTEAIRALRRRLSDEVYRRLQADEAARAAAEGVARVAA